MDQTNLCNIEKHVMIEAKNGVLYFSTTSYSMKVLNVVITFNNHVELDLLCQQLSSSSISLKSSD